LRSPLFSDRVAKLFLGVLIVFVLPAPVFYLLYDVTGKAYKDAFTWLMEFGLGISTGLFIFAIIRAIVMETRGARGLISRIRGIPWKDPGFSSLVFSIVLFAAGGLISLNLHGSNVKIPSHYHGVIGAVTIAFMGLAYHMLPLIRRQIYSERTALVQPFLYGAGQLLFVLGPGRHGRRATQDLRLCPGPNLLRPVHWHGRYGARGSCGRPGWSGLCGE
jgi:heme/copper-type cytochrome/quinol oxidase subunit 1